MKLTDEQIEAIEITDDPLISRMRFGSRYDTLFERLKVGQALKVPGGATSSVADSLERWIRRNGKTDLTTRRVTDYGDGIGRVWLVRKEPARGMPVSAVKTADGGTVLVPTGDAKKKRVRRPTRLQTLRAAEASEVGTVWRGKEASPWDGMGQRA